MFDSIIIGLGAMGSATAFHLASRGARVLGLDAFRPPHAQGSSHGRSRIIRRAYFEHPLYVPLVQRAYTLWSELEAATGRTLFARTGGLMLGHHESAVVRGALQSARDHALQHELLDHGALAHRFPMFRADRDTVALWEPDAGALDPEACVASHLGLAEASGATLRYGEAALSWSRAADGVRVQTSHGQYSARRLVISAGAWTASLLGVHAPPLQVERAVQLWFEPKQNAELFQPARMPVFIWEHAPGVAWYGIPSALHGTKLALHHTGQYGSADTVSREVHDADVAPVRALIRRHLPDADGALLESAVCLYTNTPDEHFLIDTLPDAPEVTIVSACSGHGFKFSSAIGELVADLTLDGGSAFDITPFRMARLA
ncbi:MAG TPA: N-methyl-L-tryptophan oxidase [Gemmatimonas sp.]|nr:N-methyl-L-tryptophan oxidase [Gemmatimonas sp.]